MGDKDQDRGGVKSKTKLIKKKQEKRKLLYWLRKVSQGVRHPAACLEAALFFFKKKKNYGNSCTKAEAISVRID